MRGNVEKDKLSIEGEGSKARILLIMDKNKLSLASQKMLKHKSVFKQQRFLAFFGSESWVTNLSWANEWTNISQHPVSKNLILFVRAVLNCNENSNCCRCVLCTKIQWTNFYSKVWTDNCNGNFSFTFNCKLAKEHFKHSLAVSFICNIKIQTQQRAEYLIPTFFIQHNSIWEMAIKSCPMTKSIKLASK